ncbi:MAG: hypothetical protein LHV69_10930 [Elusimicrobia bacterium]|nr:hypothetical protein [Candidatus Obscuribacterium magneticum]
MKLFIFALLLLLSGCRQDKISSYTVPKEERGGPKVSETHSSTTISWTVPAGWIEQEPSSMRVASFAIKGKQGGEADLSIVPLSGEAGGLLANINRWRSQIGLGPVEDKESKKLTLEINPGGRTMTLVDLAGGSSPHHNGELRMMIAIYKKGDTSWFFKMVGDKEVVISAKSDFLKFLSSLQFKHTE